MDLRQAAIEAATRYNIPPDLFLSLVKRESGFNPNAISPAGAIGPAQLMPGTAADLGVDPYDPVQNLDGGARYLADQYERFGDWGLALAAYNAGPGAVLKYGGIPPYKETQAYVPAVLGGASMDIGPTAGMTQPASAWNMGQPMPREPENPLEGMGLFSRIAAINGIAQDADASPLSNLWNILSGKKADAATMAAIQNRPNKGLLGMWG